MRPAVTLGAFALALAAALGAGAALGEVVGPLGSPTIDEPAEHEGHR